MNREAWAAELRRPGSARAAGLSPVSRDTVVSFPGFGEGRRGKGGVHRVSQSPQRPRRNKAL